MDYILWILLKTAWEYLEKLNYHVKENKITICWILVQVELFGKKQIDDLARRRASMALMRPLKMKGNIKWGLCLKLLLENNNMRSSVSYVRITRNNLRLVSSGNTYWEWGQNMANETKNIQKNLFKMNKLLLYKHERFL